MQHFRQTASTDSVSPKSQFHYMTCMYVLAEKGSVSWSVSGQETPVKHSSMATLKFALTAQNHLTVLSAMKFQCFQEQYNTDLFCYVCKKICLLICVSLYC